MPQSKIYTLAQARGLIILWLQQLNLSTLDSDLVDDFIKLAVREVYQLNSDAIFKLYGETQVLSDAASAFSNTTVIGGTFDSTTKTITKTPHGLTNSSIGKRIIFGRAETATGVVTYLTIATIISITDANNFVVSHTPGVSLPFPIGAADEFFYAVLPFTSQMYYDISTLNINQIRKMTDSINGEVIEVKDARDFENLSKYPQKQNKVYYFNHGDKIEMFKGANVANLGTHTLYYYAMPADPAVESDFLDVPDDLMPQVVQKAQNFVISHLASTTSQQTSKSVEDKAQLSRQTKMNQERDLAVKK
jgi:hypothetical protein